MPLRILMINLIQDEKKIKHDDEKTQLKEKTVSKTETKTEASKVSGSFIHACFINFPKVILL